MEPCRKSRRMEVEVECIGWNLGWFTVGSKIGSGTGARTEKGATHASLDILSSQTLASSKMYSKLF